MLYIFFGSGKGIFKNVYENYLVASFFRDQNVVKVKKWASFFARPNLKYCPGFKSVLCCFAYFCPIFYVIKPFGDTELVKCEVHKGLSILSFEVFNPQFSQFEGTNNTKVFYNENIPQIVLSKFKDSSYKVIYTKIGRGFVTFC